MADLNFNAASVYVEYAPGDNIELRVEKADQDEILDQIGLDDIIDHFGAELVDRIKDDNNLVEEE